MIRRNLIANAAGKLWAAALSLAVVPFYLRLLGIEAYGVIGVFLTLGPVLSLLDLGLSTTLNRRLAQLSALPDMGAQMRDLLRTLETIYWLVGVGIGAALLALAPVLAVHWIRPQQLSGEEAAQALGLMGLALACQWPLALYSGGLMGMQRQVLASAVAAAVVSVRGVGAVLVLWLVSPSLQAFFVWQIAVSAAETAVNALLLWRSMPAAASRPRFRRALLKSIWRFAAGVTGISALAVVLTQLDKIILSKLLPLDVFGYYTLACRVAVGLYYLAGPINAALFPRMSQLAAARETAALARLYHGGCQLRSVAVLPVSVVGVFFAWEILVLWTQDPAVAQGAHALLRLLLIGTALNALVTLPLSLQLAYGWTRLVLVVNAAAVVVLAPAILVAAVRFGAVGAAWVWVALNVGYLLVLVPLMHRRLLPEELRTWFVRDLARPLLAGLGVAAVWRLVADGGGDVAAVAFALVVGFAVTLGATALAAPEVRAFLLSKLRAAER